MPFYLAPYVESVGPRGNLRFMPRQSDSEWSAIDIRPDSGATLDGGGLNACLLWLPDKNADPRLELFGWECKQGAAFALPFGE